MCILDWYGHYNDGRAMHNCKQARRVWEHAPPGNFFLKLDTEFASEVMFEPKYY